MEPTLKVAKQFPDVRFEHATGFKRADNVATYNARFYEGRYVAGVVAGHMSKSGIIGYVASHPIPEVVRGINSFTLGLRSVNPDAKVKVVWVNSWFDPGKESNAATSLLDQGADILLQHTDSPAPMQVAQKRGALGFGQASDMKAFGEKAQLSAIVNNWSDYYIARTKTSAGRHMEKRRHLGRTCRGHGSNGTLCQHAGKCGEYSAQDRSRYSQRQVASVCRSD